MKVGDRVKVINNGSGFGIQNIGKEYTVLEIKPQGYYGTTGILLEGYKNSVEGGRVGISCLKVVETSEPNYEIY